MENTMKKMMTLILAAGMFLGSQVAMAGASNGLVLTDQFKSENSAVNEAKLIVEQIQSGIHKPVVSVASAKCQNLRKVKYNAGGFTVTPIWIERENGFQKEYQAKINYNISCDKKIINSDSVYN